MDVNHMLFILLSSSEGGSTYTLAGLEVNLFVKSWLAFVVFWAKHPNAGHAYCFRGAG